MKMKLIILKKKQLLWIAIMILLLSSFLFALKEISINTMNYYDPIYKGNADAPKIAFACNVVWGNEFLPDILRILKENNIKITFFIGGYWASKNEELLLDIYNDGHELGNHGYNHKKQTQLSKEQNIQEIKRTEAVVKSFTGFQTTLFAPPYGDLNDLVVKSAESQNYKVIMWSIDTIDWNTKDYNKILERVDRKKHNGAIVLMHPTKSTVQALPSLISNLKKHNYEIVTVSSVL